MTVLVYLVMISAAIVFVLACLIRAAMYARAPIHLRWELYPVPHEEPERAKHGGSRFEEADWWTKPARFGLARELRFMIPEILLLKGLYQHNRKLWYRSFPFHFGLYLLTATLGLVLAGALLMIFAQAPENSSLLAVIRITYFVTGTAGLAFTILGACGLLVRRLTDDTLKIYTTPGDIWNLLFFIGTIVLFSAACLFSAASSPDMLAVARGLLTLDTRFEIPGLLAAALCLASMLVAYIPFTHMSHFIAKYFTYHAVRWDDDASRRGGKLEARIAECLTYRPTWSAAHVGADGRKTWAQVAAAPPAPEAKK
jgi:nitrate reductase gamma subunit